MLARGPDFFCIMTTEGRNVKEYFMKDHEKTKEQLIAELIVLKRLIVELAASTSFRGLTEESLRKALERALSSGEEYSDEKTDMLTFLGKTLGDCRILTALPNEVPLYDKLTGLLNRHGFFTVAEKQLQMAGRGKMNMCLLLLYADIDRMTWINDYLGHELGDQALIEAATALKKTFRQSDTICRLGDDKFAVLLSNTTAREGEATILERLRENIHSINSQEKRRFDLSLSAGITQYDLEKPCGIEELLVMADNLMYECKLAKKPSRLSDCQQQTIVTEQGQPNREKVADG